MAVNHFYHPNAGETSNIVDIANGSQSHEGHTQTAWLEIPKKYFPQDFVPVPNSNPPLEQHYTITCQPYRTTLKPDVVAIRYSRRVPVAPGMERDRRDVLWIECKAPDQIAPNNWTRVLREVTIRLQSFHQDRQVFLIIAVGLYWLPFLWVPVIEEGAAPLEILGDNDAHLNGGVLDPRIRPFPDDLLPDDSISANRHINGNHIRIRVPNRDPQGGWIYNAYTLNFWDTDESGSPVHLQELQLVENVFAAVQAFTFTGSAQPVN